MCPYELKDAPTGAGLVPAPVHGAWTKAQDPVPSADRKRMGGSATGSEPAFAAIYDRYMPALTSYCRRLLGSSHDGEDAAQNAMVKAMRALAAKPPPEHLRPWLYRIAEREAISLARRRVRTDDLDSTHAATDSSEETALARQRLAQLISDLQALPERQREALVMRELGGHSHAEIARELGCTEAAAQQAVFDARASLHQFGEGRALECTTVQATLTDRDHGRLRTRRVRAHLRACEGCRGFEGALAGGHRTLGGLLPLLLAAPQRLFRLIESQLGSAAAKLAVVGAVAAAGAGVYQPLRPPEPHAPERSGLHDPPAALQPIVMPAPSLGAGPSAAPQTRRGAAPARGKRRPRDSGPDATVVVGRFEPSAAGAAQDASPAAGSGAPRAETQAAARPARPSRPEGSAGATIGGVTDAAGDTVGAVGGAVTNATERGQGEAGKVVDATRELLEKAGQTVSGLLPQS